MILLHFFLLLSPPPPLHLLFSFLSLSLLFLSSLIRSVFEHPASFFLLFSFLLTLFPGEYLSGLVYRTGITPLWPTLISLQISSSSMISPVALHLPHPIPVHDSSSIHPSIHISKNIFIHYIDPMYVVTLRSRTAIGPL